MVINSKYIYIVVLLLAVCGCNNRPPQEKAETDVSSFVFDVPTVPMIITDPAERAEYLVTHYWDHFDFTNKASLDHPEVVEQALADYINVMGHVSLQTAASSIKRMMKRAEVDSTMHAGFFTLYEKYLFDPNAPQRNEEFFIPVLEAVLASTVTEEVQKIRPRHLLDIVLKNRMGEPATDFTYTLSDGKKGSLHALKSEYLLLYFYNPDCEACKETAQSIRVSEPVVRLMKAGRLKILAVYPDEDLAIWKKHLNAYPADWILSYDEKRVLKEGEVYDLKAIPTMYLLDKEKKVLLKDPSFYQLERFLLITTK